MAQRSLARVGCFGAIVAGKNDYRIVLNASFFDGFENLARSIVHFSETVRRQHL
jgi:hypothetical protein